MTVEELSIKISADAQNFKNAIADANSAMDSFKRRAVTAGEEVSEAFSGLLEVGISAESGEPVGTPVPVLNDTTGRIGAAQSQADLVRSPDQPSTAGFIEYYNNENNTVSRTAAFPQLERGETVIGAVGGSSAETQPVEITTTVELDGDKVGESVSRYFVRRNRITNGIED